MYLVKFKISIIIMCRVSNFILYQTLTGIIIILSKSAYFFLNVNIILSKNTFESHPLRNIIIIESYRVVKEKKNKFIYLNNFMI